VGLKNWNSLGENVAVVERIEDTTGVNGRYVSPADGEEVKDLHSGGPTGRVERLYYLLRVFYETERDQLSDYSLIPVAQLERMGDDVRLSERFIPPALSIGTSPLLLRLVKEIRDQVSARGRQLEELKRQRGIQTAEFGSRDMVYLLALRSLNRYVPLLFQMTETRQVHPWAVYGLLRQLVGELSSFSEKVDVLGRVEAENWSLPVYDHQDLGSCFLSAQALIARLLDEITAGPEYVIRLVYDGTYFAADLKPDIFDGRNRYYLVLKTEDDPAEVIASVSTVAKLSSREQMPLLIARALPSVGLQHLPVPPQELPRRAQSVYFLADHHGEHWGKIQRGNNIVFYWDNAPKDLEVELMVVSR
jgi:type VI secretion system protein ImpJ